MTERNLARLPQWAQDRILRLEARVADLQQAYDTVVGCTSNAMEGPVELERYSPLHNLVLPPTSRIRFRHPGATLRTKREGGIIIVGPSNRQGPEGWIEVRATNGVLMTQPSSSNVIFVRAE